MSALDVTPSAPDLPNTSDIAILPLQRRGPFGFWATLSLGVLVVALALLIAGMAYVALAGSQSEIDAVDSILVLMFADFAAVGAIALVLALGARRRGWTIADYLGLDWPRARVIAFGVGCYIPFQLASFGLMFIPSVWQAFLEASRDWVEFYQAAMAGGFVLLLWITVVIAAPVAEELLFRGFLYRGWSESRIGAIGAVLLTSIIWSMLHVGYPSIIIGLIFAMGVGFGWLRWRTGSTTLTVMLHALHNFIAMVMYAGAAHEWWAFG